MSSNIQSEIWTDLPLQEGQILIHKIGPVTIHIKKLLNEIWIAHQNTSKSESEKEQEVAENTEPLSETDHIIENPKTGVVDESALSWTRWAMKEEITNISFRPVFPDRPVVIKPEYPFNIASDSKARVYTRIPVFIRITPVKEPDHIITEIPTMKITGTWFGDFTEGELCYWVTTRARRMIPGDEEWEPHLAICPLNITNKASVDLPFDKMSLRVDRFTMFFNQNVLWSDETNITYQGGDKHSDIEMSGKVAKDVKAAKMISLPRTPVKKSIAVRTFKLLKDLPTFGLTNI